MNMLATVLETRLKEHSQLYTDSLKIGIVFEEDHKICKFLILLCKIIISHMRKSTIYNSLLLPYFT